MKKTNTKTKTKKTTTAKAKSTKSKPKTAAKPKTKKKAKAKLDNTHIIAILDKSGSMDTVAQAAIDGFNEFLREQKKLKGKATMDVVLFSTHTAYTKMEQGADINNVKELTNLTYQPNGYTALYDAIGITTRDYKIKFDAMKPSQRPDKVLVLIITDGHENNSQEFKDPAFIKDLITTRKKDNWQFLFLCSTEDAMFTGQSLGVSAGNTMQFTNTNAGNQAMYSSVASAATLFRSTSLKSKKAAATYDNLLNTDDSTDENA